MTDDEAAEAMHQAAYRADHVQPTTTGVVRFWEPRPVLFAMVAGVAALVAFATLIAARTSLSTASDDQPGTTTLTSSLRATPETTTTTTPMPTKPANAAPIAVTRAPVPTTRRAEPTIPVFDVNSLPPAPRRAPLVRTVAPVAPVVAVAPVAPPAVAPVAAVGPTATDDEH